MQQLPRDVTSLIKGFYQSKVYVVRLCSHDRYGDSYSDNIYLVSFDSNQVLDYVKSTEPPYEYSWSIKLVNTGKPALSLHNGLDTEDYIFMVNHLFKHTALIYEIMNASGPIEYNREKKLLIRGNMEILTEDASL